MCTNIAARGSQPSFVVNGKRLNHTLRQLSATLRVAMLPAQPPSKPKKKKTLPEETQKDKSSSPPPLEPGAKHFLDGPRCDTRFVTRFSRTSNPIWGEEGTGKKKTLHAGQGGGRWKPKSERGLIWQKAREGSPGVVFPSCILHNTYSACIL